MSSNDRKGSAAQSTTDTPRTVSDSGDGKDGKKKRRKSKRRKTALEKKEVAKVSEFDLPGIFKLPLSPMTQKIIGCVVGENVTAENQWISIRKDIIEDNVELHDESSEFLPIKTEIVAYPEPNIFVGFIPDESDEKDQFYICLSSVAKQQVLNILERREENLKRRLKNSVWRSIGKWQSLGSDVEIVDNQIRNFRPLFEIQIDTRIPIIEGKITFKMRRAEAAIDGYIEILPSRFPFTNVERKRVDRAIQAAPSCLCHEVQTTPTYPSNIWTQYEYEYRETTFDTKGKENIHEFIKHKLENLDDTIRVNSYINMYEDDYAKLISTPVHKMQLTDRLTPFVSFSDVQSCGGKDICDVAWHPMISGIVAVCYSSTPNNYIYSKKPTGDDVADAVHGSSPVLVWSYNDGLHPKLYLETNREVSSISFCPYNGNILLGGCVNGQVVIWDITNKIKEVETKEILTVAQQKHRLTILSMMSWMKNTRNIAVVPPTAISTLEFGHTDVITGFKWLSPEWEITNTGRLQKCEDTTSWSRQFLTSGLDGIVFAWDLITKEQGPAAAAPKRKGKRLKKTPSALTINVSEYKSWHKNFKPHYKLLISDGDKFVPVTSIAMIDPELFYSPIDNPSDDYKVRTTFKIAKVEDIKFQPCFAAISSIGKMLRANWEGFDFNAGQKINSEQCKMTPYQTIHDGPITVAVVHAFIDDFILTIGGKIFSTWRLMRSTPVLWRKSDCRYMHGGFSSNHPSYLMLVRYDGLMELWDFLERSHKPSRVISISGGPLMMVRGTMAWVHVRKNTFGLADVNGVLRIFTIPNLVTTVFVGELEKMRELICRSDARKYTTTKWVAQYRKRLEETGASADPEHALRKDTVPAKDATAKHKEKKESDKKKDDKGKGEPPHELSEIDKMDMIFTGVHWNTLQEKAMYDTMLEKKKLNLAELEQQKKPLQRIALEEKERREKQEKILGSKDVIFENAKTQLYQTVKPKRREESIVMDELSDSKVSFFTNYKEVEAEALTYIKKNKFREEFDWNQLLHQGKQRRNNIETALNYYMEHTDRQKNRKMQREFGDLKENISPLVSTAVDEDQMDESITEYEQQTEVHYPEPIEPDLNKE